MIQSPKQQIIHIRTPTNISIKLGHKRNVDLTAVVGEFTFVCDRLARADRERADRELADRELADGGKTCLLMTSASGLQHKKVLQ